MMRKLVWLALIGLLLVVQVGSVQAQSSAWSDPLNLSRSGAAEQPRLVVAPDGKVQAFWWDRFDGLTTAYSNGVTWTGGISTPLALDEGKMPEFLLDASGRIHAFWRKQDDQVEGQLWHASMPLGEATWAVVELVAESTLDFKALALEDGAIVLAYLRVAQSWGAPAGIQFLRLEPGVFYWNTPIGLDTSAYYRLETVETAWLHLAADGDILTITWHEPRSGEYRAKTSLNGGWTWASTETLIQPVAEMDQPRSLYWGDGRMLIWQDEGSAGCTLIQRGGDENWQTGLSGITECPHADTSWSTADRLFWMWGEGERVISLAAWDGLIWTQPLGLGFSFTDPLNSTTRNLQDLHAVQVGGRLFILGSDGVGEVWFVQSDLDALQLLEAPRPDWGIVSRISSRGMAAGEPALVVDASGVFHLVWLEGPSEDVFRVLNYTKVAGSTVGQPVAVKGAAAGEFFRQPALFADPDGWLHLAWSGGSRGEIRYSRVRLEDAENPGAWSPVQLLSTEAGTYPQMARDAAGRLYLLYVKPLNEGRGVYLVRSLDHGDVWAQPELVFDAQAAGWDNLGSAALAVAPSLDGGNTVSVHVAWGEETLPGTLPPQGIWYARALTSLLSSEPMQWSSPFEVAGEQAAWPRLVISGGDVHLVYAVRGLGIWDRYLPLDAPSEDVSGWSTAVPAAGWDSLQTSNDRTFGVAASGSTGTPGGVLHLVGMPINGRLAYTQWADGRWGDMEGYALAAWNAGPAEWVDAASMLTGSTLGLTWFAVDETGLPAVFWIGRIIPVIDVLPEPTPIPTPVLQDDPGIAPTATIQPSPTPDLNLAPAMTFSSSAPLILGGGLAALLVIGFLLIRRRTR
jgi:hypothetical protein